MTIKRGKFITLEGPEGSGKSTHLKMLEKYLGKVVEKEDLTAEEAENAMRAIMSGEANKIQTAAFLASLRMKGETEEEIAAFARVMRNLALKISPIV